MQVMAATGAFKRIADALFWVSVGQLCLALLIPGDIVPPPQNASSGPASACAAQFELYRNVAVLRFLLVGAVLSCSLLVCHVKVGNAGGGGEETVHVARRRRVLLLLAILFSAAGTGIAVAAFTELLQIRAGVLSCLPGEARAAVYATYAAVGAAAAVMYGALARDALFAV